MLRCMLPTMGINTVSFVSKIQQSKYDCSFPKGWSLLFWEHLDQRTSILHLIMRYSSFASIQHTWNSLFDKLTSKGKNYVLSKRYLDSNQMSTLDYLLERKIPSSLHGWLIELLSYDSVNINHYISRLPMRLKFTMISNTMPPEIKEHICGFI